MQNAAARRCVGNLGFSSVAAKALTQHPITATNLRCFASVAAKQRKVRAEATPKKKASTTALQEESIILDVSPAPTITIDAVERPVGSHFFGKNDAKSWRNSVDKRVLISACLSQLRCVDRPLAVNLITQTEPNSVVGWKGNESPLLAEIRGWKEELISEYLITSSTNSKTTTNEGTSLQSKTQGRDAQVNQGQDRLANQADGLIDPAIVAKGHPYIVLTRVGEFYEAWGYDAIQLIQWCGLNPMGGKPKAGCPLNTIQQTCDSLTAEGFKVAVFEERAPQGHEATARGKKERWLSQIVTAALPTYNSKSKSRSQLEARPVIAIKRSINRGFDLCEIYLEDQSYRRMRSLTREAVRAWIERLPGIAEIVCYNCGPQRLPFLKNYAGTSVITKPYAEDYVERTAEWISISRDRFLRDFRELNAAPTSVNVGGIDSGLAPLPVSVARFLGLVTNSSGARAASQGSTAVYADENLSPMLIKYLLPPQAPAFAHKFLQGWLLSPPSEDIRKRFRNLVYYCENVDHHIPKSVMRPLNFQQLHGLEETALSDGAAPALTTVSSCLEAFLTIAGHVEDASKKSCSLHESRFQTLVEDVEAVAVFGTGLHVKMNEAEKTAQRLLNEIDAVLMEPRGQSEDTGTEKGKSSDTVSRMIDAFENLEGMTDADTENVENFFGKKKQMLYMHGLSVCMDRIEEAEKALHTYVSDMAVKANAQIEFVSARDPRKTNSKRFKSQREFKLMCQDGLYLKKSRKHKKLVQANPEVGAIYEAWGKPIGGAIRKNADPGEELSTAGASSGSRFKPARLEELEDACAREISIAETEVEEKASAICKKIREELETLLWVSQVLVLFAVSSLHAEEAMRKNWWLIDEGTRTTDSDAKPGIDTHQFALQDLRPYWLSQESCVANTMQFRLDDIIVLTAPNAAGKSCLLRSLLATILLKHCGLYAPIGPASNIPEFSQLFASLPTGDCPTEDRSTFENEALQLAEILAEIETKEGTRPPFLIVDEWARGTSAKEGSCLAAAVLEKLESMRVPTVFATHLHEMLDLPIGKEGQGLGERRKYLTMKDYRAYEGQCRSSRAFECADKAGMPKGILNRANELMEHLQNSKLVPATQNNALARASIQVKDSNPVEIDRSSAQETDSSKNNDRNNDTIEKLDGDTLVRSLMKRVVSDISPTSWICYLESSQLRPPPKLNATACLYVLRLHNSMYYVGETSRLLKRLDQHRLGRRYEACFIAPLGNRSNAQRAETQLIRLLQKEGAKHGVVLESAHDAGRSCLVK